MNISAWITIVLLALSASIDNFGVGISYGIRGIRIGFWANAVIAVTAFLFSETGIVCGRYISKIFPGVLSNVIGAAFLIIIGLRIILLTIPRKKHVDAKEDSEGAASSNLVTNYLTSPEKADLDQSGHINLFEAVILGVAVSMNALTNGLGVGLIGLSPLGISLSAAVFSFLAIWAGVALGKRVANVKIGVWTIGECSTVVSGVILVIIALHNLL